MSPAVLALPSRCGRPSPSVLKLGDLSVGLRRSGEQHRPRLYIGLEESRLGTDVGPDAVVRNFDGSLRGV